MAVVALLPIKSMAGASASGECTGSFPNPITDVCWDCLFPLTIGDIELVSGFQADTPNPSLPICECPLSVPPFVQIGLSIGFWEPLRLVDVTKRPYCFVNLGGLSIDLGIGSGPGAVRTAQGHSHESSWYVHWYIYPLLYWLNILTDVVCLEQSSFDIAYITEVDPLWMDDDLTFILNPEAVLFGNPLAQAACAADCVTASTYLPLDALFWCAGCQGSMYPLDGRIGHHVGGVQSSMLAAERFTYKLHREGILWGSVGMGALCALYPMPVILKSQYREQMTNPVPTASGPWGCTPYGSTSTLWEAGHEIPVSGEDFGYLIWRKRSCCAF